MDIKKSGRLIAACRKEQNLTQKELASRLMVTEQAVSKWERGLNFPDMALLEPLCRELNITVTEFLRGERESLTLMQMEQLIEDTVLMAGEKELEARWMRRAFGVTIGILVVLIVLVIISLTR